MALFPPYARVSIHAAAQHNSQRTDGLRRIARLLSALPFRVAFVAGDPPLTIFHIKAGQPRAFTRHAMLCLHGRHPNTAREFGQQSFCEIVKHFDRHETGSRVFLET